MSANQISTDSRPYLSIDLFAASYDVSPPPYMTIQSVSQSLGTAVLDSVLDDMAPGP